MHYTTETYKLNNKDTFYRLGEFSFSENKIDKQTLLYKGYLVNAFMYMLCNRIGEVCANMPYHFIDDNGNPVEESNEQIQALFEKMDSYDEGAGKKVFIEKCIVNLLALGEFFIYKGEKAVGFEMPEYLDIISPADVTINTYSGYAYSPVKSYNVSYYNQSTITPDEMVWGKYPNIDEQCKRGLSPFEPMWDVVKATTNSFKAHGVLLNNMGANGIFASEAGENAFPLTEKEQNILQKAIDRVLTGVKNFAKSVITRASMKWIPIGMDPNKLEILKMQESSLRILCAGVNMDSKLFNDSSASTYNNMNEAQKQAYLAAYAPTAQYFFDVMSRHFLDGIHWRVDKSKIEVLNERDLNYEREVREQMLAGILSAEQALNILHPELTFEANQNNNENEE